MSDSTKFIKITPPPTREAMDKFMEEQKEKSLKAGEHDCWELVTHGHYKRDNGGYNDYYECSVCGCLLQVG